MTTTFERPLGAARQATLEPTQRPRWALWGAAAAAFGGIATLLPTKVNVAPTSGSTTSEIIATLHRWPYQVGVAAGFVAVACMLLTATGWRRWAAQHAPASMAAETISRALTATAGAMMIGFGFLGSLAVYLHGGIDQHMFGHDGLFAVYMIVDFGPYVAWWGVTVAAAAVTWLALRERMLPRWIGIVSAAAVAIAVVPLVLTGLPPVCRASSVPPGWQSSHSACTGTFARTEQPPLSSGRRRQRVAGASPRSPSLLLTSASSWTSAPSSKPAPRPGCERPSRRHGA
jgi:hypothetical protein